MTVHTAAVVAEQGFGMNVTDLAVLIRDVTDDVFVQHHVVGRLDERVEALVDLALAARRDLVVMAFDVEAAS